MSNGQSRQCSDSQLTGQAVVLDVPFIGWGDERLPVGEMNRSHSASVSMVLEYWGLESLELDEAESKEVDSVLNNWIGKNGRATSVDDLRPFIADGLPVMVAPTALTPFAHPTNPLFYMLGVTTLPDTRVISANLSGVFVPLDTPELAVDPKSPEKFARIQEDFWWSARVVVGYDDSRSVIVLHDPTFGPYWAVSFDDFDEMWRVGGRNYSVMHPPDFRDRADKRPFDAERTSRSVGNQTTVRYVFGYALSSIGRNREAEIQLKQGLRIAGREKGYRFLLLLELAIVQAKRGYIDEAMASAKEASQLFPRHHASWYLLANLRRPRPFGRLTSAWWLLKAKLLQNVKMGSAGLPRNLNYSEFV